jgi:hypothetical protein
MNKGPANLMPALYSHRIHDITTIARACGYAAAIHGSMQRDLDVVMVPWTQQAVPAQALVNHLCLMLGVEQQAGAEGPLPPSVRPHGRIVYTLMMGGSCFMDLSVMPLEGSSEEVQALRDMLDDTRGLLDMIRERLGVPVEPHQTINERILETVSAVVWPR